MAAFGSLRAQLALAMAVLVVSGLTIGAGQATAMSAHRSARRADSPAGLFAPGRTGFQASASELAGSEAKALHSASAVPRGIRAGAVVPRLRRRDSDTYLAGSGRLVTKVFAGPVNYKSPAGSFAPIDPTLVKRSAGLVQQANNLGVLLPTNATDPAKVSNPKGSLAFSLSGASRAGSLAGTAETFSGALPGVDLSLSSLNQGVGWQTSLSAAAASRGVRWVLSPSSGLTAKLVHGGVALRNAHGATVWMFAAPTARVTRTGQLVSVRLSIRTSARGTVVTLKPSVSPAVASMTRSATDVRPDVAAISSPVTMNGAVVSGSFTFLNQTNQTGDCYIDSTNPNTSTCQTATNYVGPHDHALLNFDVADNIPQHSQVLQAYVNMELSSESSTTAESVGVYEAAQPWTNFATWNTYDGTNSWTTPGGDVTSTTPETTQSIGASADVGNNFYWDATTMVQGWVDNPAQNNGVIMEPTAGGSAPNTLGFYTSTGAGSTYSELTVYWEPRMGDYPGAKYDTQQLTDRSTLGVNVANGNLELSNNDVSLAGVNGLELNIDRTYNNLSGDQDSFGTGWSMGAGADTYLVVPCDGANLVDYFDGTGNAQLYTDESGTMVAPPGSDMALTISGGYAYNASTYTLYGRHSGITETFTATANQCNKIARLSTITDRHGNTITYHYNGSGQLTAITDSYGNTTTITYTAGYVSEIQDATGRTWKYYQNASGQLTSYQDPAGNTTYYTYSNGGNLNQITTPQGYVTQIEYDDESNNAAAMVKRYATTTKADKTTYQIAPASGTCPVVDAGATQDTVKDPNGHVTTYCTDDMSRITSSVDANGNAQSTTYSPDGFVNQLTSPLGTQTNIGYSSDGRDNINSVSEGTGTGQINESFQSSDTTNNPYLPTMAQDPAANQTNNVYDTWGDLTSATQSSEGTGSTLTPTNSGVVLTYNTSGADTDGTVKTSQDPDGNVTTYSYTAHHLTTVSPPTGSGLNPIHLTYDTSNRVWTISSVSGTTGHEVDYTYDNLDRVTQALYKNAAGTTVATIGYTYDDDGNLLTRTDPAGTTTYTYNTRDELTGETFPDSSTDTYGYDATGNLTSLTDAGGKVTYIYNNVNQLTAVKDPNGTKVAKMTYDKDGSLLSTVYPSGASVVSTYNAEDQRTSLNNTYKTSGGGVAHFSWTLGYAGGLLTTSNDQSANDTTYTYDALDRLVQAKAVNGSTTIGQYGYTLDNAGNLRQIAVSGTALTASTTSYAYNPGDQICWSYTGASSNACGTVPTGGHSYTYDADGNQTNNGNGTTQTYNTLQQMTSMTVAGTATNYSYLGAGQNQLTADGTTTLHNDLLGLASTTTSGASTYYTRSPNGNQIDERTPSGTNFYLYDPQGSVTGLVNSAGQLVRQYYYSPYGAQTVGSGTVTNPFGFQDGYQTADGLYHYGARYENPGQGNWTQLDPSGADAGYTFAGTDPVNQSDPDGMKVPIPNYGNGPNGPLVISCGAKQFILSVGRCHLQDEGFADVVSVAAGVVADCYEGSDKLSKYGEGVIPRGGAVTGFLGCVINVAGPGSLNGL